MPAQRKYTGTVHNCLATVLSVDDYIYTRNYGKIVGLSNIEVYKCMEHLLCRAV